MTVIHRKVYAIDRKLQIKHVIWFTLIGECKELKHKLIEQ